MKDIAELRQMSSQKITQNRCQENKNKIIAAKLVEEYEDFDDDVFMANDVMDTNENLPTVLLTFIQWLSEGVDSSNNAYTNPNAHGGNGAKSFLSSIISSIINRYNRHNPVNFSYLLITNDDSFIAIDQLLPRLAFGGPAYFRTKEFRSRFDYFSAVNYHGMVPEKSYISSTYPPIPAESGSLLSKDLIQFIAISSRTGLLQTFSSVGKSLSVWLAPAGPNYIDDSGWNLDNISCPKHSIAAHPFNEPKLMMRAWENYLGCGKMCECA